MLNKLLKYDLQTIFKFLTIFYGLALFFALLTRLFFQIENSFILKIIAYICNGTTIAMIANILINNLMRLWIRFKQNFYGDESYLTHTLPVEKKTLYTSKFLTAIISLVASVFVIALLLFIAYYSKDNLNIIKQLLLPLTNIYNSSVIKFILIILLIFFLEMANLLQAGYTGIILGHRHNHSKIPFSILFSFLTYMFTQLFVLLLTFIVALFNSDIMTLFFTNELTNFNSLKSILFIALLAYTITIISGYFINIKLFKTGVNVD